MTEPWATLKGLALAAFMAFLLSAAFLTPMTLHLKITDSIAPVARFFCPETGVLAPRYYNSSSSSDGPEDWLACLDAAGNRIERIDLHKKIVWSHIGFWFALTFPLFVQVFRLMFRSTEAKLKRQAKVH